MSIMTKDFSTLYNQVLNEDLTILEQQRKKGIHRFKTYLYISIPFLILSVFAIILKLEPMLILITGFIGLALLWSGFGIISKTMKLLKPQFKKRIILPTLEYIYEDVEYIPRQRMSKSLLIKSLLIEEKAIRVEGDDFVRCRLGKTMIQFSEIEVEPINNYSVIYAGIFISASFNKSFKTKTIVIPENLTNNLRKFKLNIRKRMNNAEIIKLEDSVFEKEFIVIGEDQIEARYLLSTSLMQRLLDYKNKINKKVSFSFIDNRLYVLFPIKKDMFEPRIFEPINDESFIKSNYDYFQLLTDLVADLDLNVRIWE